MVPTATTCIYVCVLLQHLINPFVIYVITKENREAAEWVVL